MKKEILFLLFIISNYFLYSQQVRLNEYGLPVVNDTETYLKLIEDDTSKMLLNLEDEIHGVILDIRYASADNFFGSAVYSEAMAFLRKPAVEALKNVQRELNLQHKGLKIFDAYRPYSVTVMFYEKIRDTNFVASAWSGSRHNRGCAVDLTLIDLNTNKELKMPTEYDDFTEKAAIDFNDVSDEERKNRQLLRTLMEKYGFTPLKSEWWHYDFHDWKNYELTDISFSELEKINKELKENARK
jgi:zinc D-Ala-D-Ala dipeptidase